MAVIERFCEIFYMRPDGLQNLVRQFIYVMWLKVHRKRNNLYVYFAERRLKQTGVCDWATICGYSFFCVQAMRNLFGSVYTNAHSAHTFADAHRDRRMCVCVWVRVCIFIARCEKKKTFFYMRAWRIDKVGINGVSDENIKEKSRRKNIDRSFRMTKTLTSNFIPSTTNKINNHMNFTEKY